MSELGPGLSGGDTFSSVCLHSFSSLLPPSASFLLLQNPVVPRDKELKECLYTIIASCATKYEFLEASVSGVVHLIHTKEHAAPHMADLLTQAEDKFSGCPLVPAVVRDVGRTPMSELARANGPAKSIAAFLVALSEKLPRQAALQVAVMVSFLSADSAPMRSAVIALVGNLLVRVYRDRPPVVDERGYGIWLKAKEGLLGLLLERVKDKGSYVRSKVLMTWSQLCEEKAVPIGHWTEVARLAIGRLQDKTPTVRKSALQVIHGATGAKGCVKDAVLCSRQYGSDWSLQYTRIQKPLWDGQSSTGGWRTA